jgi:hypothetical protein
MSTMSKRCNASWTTLVTARGAVKRQNSAAVVVLWSGVAGARRARLSHAHAATAVSAYGATQASVSASALPMTTAPPISASCAKGRATFSTSAVGRISP